MSISLIVLGPRGPGRTDSLLSEEKNGALQAPTEITWDGHTVNVADELFLNRKEPDIYFVIFRSLIELATRSSALRNDNGDQIQD